MSNDDTEDVGIYRVVINHEEQYSIWPEWKEIPAGWRAVGPTGKKQECLTYIGEVWTDMRPLSLRKQMEANAASAAVAEGMPDNR
jgi:MbtH protein